VVGFFTQETKGKPSNPSKFIPITTQVTTATTSPISPEKTSEINTVQTTTSGKDQSSGSKKKNKVKAKQNSQQKEKNKTPLANETQKWKPKYPCLICEEDHYTKDCPRRADVKFFLK
jgi:hypothetical protein